MSDLIFLLLFINVTVLFAANFFRIKKIIRFLEIHREQLGESKYLYLTSRYNGPFKLLEKFPSEDESPELHNDVEFIEYSKRRKSMLRTLSISALFLLLALLVALAVEKL